MLSIEEAHRRALTAIDEAVGWVPPKREAEHMERILAAHIAVCDLALAVLEKEHDGSSDLSCRCMTWSKGVRCRSYGEARARIKALGL